MKKVLSVLLAVLLIISSMSGVITVTSLAEGENLWVKRTGNDIVKFSAAYLGLNSSSATSISFYNPEYSYFCVKMPELEAGATYKFSSYVYTTNADLKITNIAILNQSEFEKAQSDSANYYAFPNSAKRIGSGTYTKNAVSTTPCEFKADGSQYYLGFRTAGVSNKTGTVYLNLSSISLTKVPTYSVEVTDGTASLTNAEEGATVTLSFNDSADKVFEKWEVVSGNVVLADETSLNTTFTMPTEAVSVKAIYKTNLWTSVLASDINRFTGYGSFSSYNNKQLKLSSMAWQVISVKLPELEQKTKYNLSFDYILEGTGTSFQYFAMVLFSETEHNAATSDILNSKYTKQVLYNSTNVLTDTRSVDFTTSTDTTYYLAIACQTAYGNLTLNNLVLQKVVSEQPFEFSFENASNWERYAYGTVNTSEGPLAADKNTWHKIAENTSKTQYIKEGDSSVAITPQSQINLIKLKNLKPNTNYLLKFSYITDSMKNSAGTEKNNILSGCGIWNYAAEDAKFAFSNSKSNGYLHVTNFTGTYFDSFFESDGTVTNDYFSKKPSVQQAGTWYEKQFLFNSGSVYETLSLVVILEVNAVYLDSFSLVCLDDIKGEETQFTAPAVSGKTVSGSYESLNATTTLYNEITAEDFENYKTTILNDGFEEYAVNAYGDNQFATYTKSNLTVNVTYNPYNGTMLISEQTTDNLPLTAEQNIYTDKGYQPLIIQLDHNNASGGGVGMSYAIRLADGSFIMVDGGHSETAYDNADRIYNTLREYSPEGKLQIAAWLITHGHDDHIGGMLSFIEKYNNDVVIEEIIYNYASVSQYASTETETIAGGFSYNSVTAFLLGVEAFLPDTKISTCHSGYKYNVRNAVIDVMFTLEDIYPKVLGTDYTDVNNTSTVYKISFTDEMVEQTLLITGDAAHHQCSEMLNKYSGEELKSTFVQVIHHGINYGSYELYGKINPEIVLFPASSNRLMNVLYQNQNSYFVKEDSVKEVILSDYGTRAIALPYTAPEGLTGLSKFTIPADFNSVNALNSYVGVSIRQAGENGTSAKQALRFKFQIPEHIIRANTVDGFTVAEYGMMVSESDSELNFYEGNDAYIKMSDGTKVFKGIAYNKANSKNVVYDYVNYANLDDGESRSTQYTCALYNIGVGSNGVTDYTKYDTTYYVRSYITFKNSSGETKVYYGDVKSASVFAVMQEILKSTATDEQTESDKTYVKNFLDGNVNGFLSAAAIKEAWMAEETRASLYTPSN